MKHRPVIEPPAAPVAAGAALVQIVDLAKSYRVRGRLGFGRRYLRAVDGVSFEVFPGESLGLVGESGSGKSTVARLLLGLTDRTRGTVVFEGRPLEVSRHGGVAREHRGRVQMVFQDPGDSLDPMMTIDSIVAEPLYLLRGEARSGAAGRVPQLLELVGLERRSAVAGRSSSPAGSGSASRSPARSPPTPHSSSATRRSPRSTSRCAPRS